MTAPRKLSTATFFALIAGFYILLSYIQRAILIIWIIVGRHQFPERIPVALGKGLLFDLAATGFLFLPVVLWFLVPRRFGHRAWFKIPLFLLCLLSLSIATISAICEMFFFDEFHARYNFIAVDYLIYTTEVVHNILESYSVLTLFAALLLPVGLLAWALSYLVARLDRQVEPSRAISARIVGMSVLVALCAALVSEDGLLSNESYWPRELSKNALFALFSAYHRNSINYHEFYSSLDSREAMRLTRQWLEPGSTVDDEKAALRREVKTTGAPKDWNVVMVVMESMSARFLTHFGNPTPLTPNLDRLADSGILFTNLYATGTRTVRGLEALMLSIPPTPGQSILRRPGSDHLANIGTVFADHGYMPQFIYGGYAYFDNMREWFEGNGFAVVDRSNFPSSEIHFANAWGVCDEDLFAQALKAQAEVQASGKPFFQVVLTTSNHRPYTFPEGRIDMPPHNGREPAIKYSDYAIGKFIEDAKTTPWFKNTLFIFVADHDASVAGGTDIPVRDYLIPAIFYNPNLVGPEKISLLASQIDLAPTLLGMLNFSYQNRFFGEDLRQQPGGRALLGTYQKVALLQPHSLTVLAPGRSIESQQLDDNYMLVKSSTSVNQDAAHLSEASKLTIAIYQAASELFSQGLLKATAGNMSSSAKSQ